VTVGREEMLLALTRIAMKSQPPLPGDTLEDLSRDLRHIHSTATWMMEKLMEKATMTLSERAEALLAELRNSPLPYYPLSRHALYMVEEDARNAALEEAALICEARDWIGIKGFAANDLANGIRALMNATPMEMKE